MKNRTGYLKGVFTECSRMDYREIGDRNVRYRPIGCVTLHIDIELNDFASIRDMNNVIIEIENGVVNIEEMPPETLE
jgi:hypothetical protein